MKNKRTALEMFIAEINEFSETNISDSGKMTITFPVDDFEEVLYHAKKMEKEIIIKTYDVSLPFITGKEFYEHIFGNQNQP